MARHIAEQPVEEDVIKVKIGAVGSRFDEFVLEKGTTVSQALEKAGYDRSGQVRINGQPYGNGDELEDGDEMLVISSEPVKGGSR